jgi:hypothetical protein
MRRYLTRFIAIAAAVAATACGAELDVEEVPLGSEVALTRQDGGVVQGRLTERDAEVVKVAVGPTTRELPRADIADVTMVTADTPVELPAEAKFRECTVPAGTELTLKLESAVDSKTARVNSTVPATLTEALMVDGVTVAPAGSEVAGVVTAVEPSGKVKGRASLTLAFRTLMVDGHEAPYTIAAGTSFVADSTKKDDAAKIGAPAVGGAVIGGILGGKKGAVIGGIVGGGAGTAVVLTTAGDEVELPAGTTVRVALAEPVTLRVPIER